MKQCTTDLYVVCKWNYIVQKKLLYQKDLIFTGKINHIEAGEAQNDLLNNMFLQQTHCNSDLPHPVLSVESLFG